MEFAELSETVAQIQPTEATRHSPMEVMGTWWGWGTSVSIGCGVGGSRLCWGQQSRIPAELGQRVWHPWEVPVIPLTPWCQNGE